MTALGHEPIDYAVLESSAADWHAQIHNNAVALRPSFERPSSCLSQLPAVGHQLSLATGNFGMSRLAAQSDVVNPEAPPSLVSA